MRLNSRGGGTQANNGTQLPAQAPEKEEVRTAESEDSSSQEESTPEDEITTEESSEETEESTSQIESSEESQGKTESKVDEETEQSELVQPMAEEQALGGDLPAGGLDLATGSITVASETEVTQTISGTTNKYAITAGQEIKITQSDVTTATENTITVADNCGAVNIVLSNVNIVTSNNAIDIGEGSETTISTEGENKLSGYSGIDSDSELILSGEGSLNATGGICGISANGAVTISSGEVSATGTFVNVADGGEGYSYGIYANSGNVEISGGTVNATGIIENIEAGGYGYSYGIYANSGNVEISGGTVNATGIIGSVAESGEGYSYGIYANSGNVEISGGTVNAAGTIGSVAEGGYGYSYGICANSGIVEISGGEVTATGTIENIEADGYAESYGIYAYSGNVEISGGTVNATGTIASVAEGGYAEGYGISASNVTISGGEVTATGTGSGGNGICAASNVEISQSGEVNTKVTATGQNEGICTDGDVTISQESKKPGATTVIATAVSSTSSGINSNDYSVIIKGGEITAKGLQNGIIAKGVQISEDEAGTTRVIAEGSTDPYVEDGTEFGRRSYGIDSYEGAVTISGGEVTAKGNEIGISCEYENINISGGKVIATGVGNKINYDVSGDGVYCVCGMSAEKYSDQDNTGKVIITGTANVKAKGIRAGIYSDGGTINLDELTSGTVIAVADTESVDKDKDKDGMGGILMLDSIIDEKEIENLSLGEGKITFPEKEYVFYQNEVEPSDDAKLADYQVEAISVLEEQEKNEGTESTILYNYLATKDYVKVAPLEAIINYIAETGGKVSPPREEIGSKESATGSTATANAGYVLVGWYDADGEELGTDASFVPAKNAQGVYEEATYTARFEKAVTITYQVEEGGRVSRGSEIIGVATGKPEGSIATANAGYVLVGWYKDGELVGEDAQFKPAKNAQGVYEEATYTAKFEEQEVTIIYQAEGGGSVDPKSETIGAVTEDPEGSIATANAGYVLVGWYDADGEELGTDASFVPAKNAQGVYEEATYTAKFAKEDVTSDEENENIQDVDTSDSTQTGQNMTMLYLSLAVALVSIAAIALFFKKKMA